MSAALEKGVTASEAGLSVDEQLRIVLRAIADRGGKAEMRDLYEAVEKVIAARLGGIGRLSDQGKASLRELVNRRAVREGYLLPHDPSDPGWRSTPKGRQFAG